MDTKRLRRCEAQTPADEEGWEGRDEGRDETGSGRGEKLGRGARRSG